MTPEGRGLRLEAIKDAAIAGAQTGLCRQYLQRAIGGLEKVDRLGVPGPASAELANAGVYARQALLELEALRRTLRDHFDRLGAPPSLELNRP